jgi:hypothetical protein
MKIVVCSSLVNLTVYFLFIVIPYKYRVQPTLIYNVVKAIYILSCFKCLVLQLEP